MNRWLITLFAFFLTLNGWSYHFDRGPNWNEKNNINGFEYEYKEGKSVECVSFINSFNNKSTACGFNFSSKNISVKFGGVAGYSDHINLYILPAVYWRYKLVKIDFIIVPTAVILMFKIEI